MKTIKNNQQGFTLIELLAIIVILAVIMAIAIPQVLNVVNGSKDSAWKDNVKMISKAIELNTQMFDPETGGYTYTVESLCRNPNNVNKISKSTDTKVTCSSNVFTINGTGQFDGKTATIDCRIGSCITNFSESGVVAEATCPGPSCRYLYTDKMYRYGTDGSIIKKTSALNGNIVKIGAPASLNDTDVKKDYNEVISKTGKDYFLGVILSDGDYGKIERAFACGIRNGKVFCLEGSTDGSTYETNKDILRKNYSRDYIFIEKENPDLDDYANTLVTKGYIESASEITSYNDFFKKSDGICFDVTFDTSSGVGCSGAIQGSIVEYGDVSVDNGYLSGNCEALSDCDVSVDYRYLSGNCEVLSDGLFRCM